MSKELDEFSDAAVENLDLPESGTRMIDAEGNELIEIIVPDAAPPDDDDETSTVWGTEIGDERLDMEQEDGTALDDMAVAVFCGHTDSVYCAAIHPSIPGLIITGGGDDRAFIWTYQCDDGVHDGRITSVIELSGHTDTVASCGFNFDGSLALTGAYDGTVRVWDVRTGELKTLLEGPEDVEWTSWHPKGNALLAGSSDGTVWMWLAGTGQCMQVFAGHDGRVSCGVFSKDGKQVVTGGDDGTVRIWNPKTGACRHVFEGHFAHSASVTCLADLDSDCIMSGSEDGSARLYMLSTKRLLQTFVHSTSENLSATGSMYLSGDIDDREEENNLSVECVGFCASSTLKWAATGGLDKTMKIWEISSGACRGVCVHGDSVVALRWHSSLPLIATSALDNIVRIWDARSSSCMMSLTGHSNLVTNLEMAPVISLRQAEGDEHRVTDIIVSVSDDGTARVFHISGPALITL